MKKFIFGAMAAIVAAGTLASCSNDKSAAEQAEELANDTTDIIAEQVDVESAKVDTVVNNGDTTINVQTVDQVTPVTVE